MTSKLAMLICLSLAGAILVAADDVKKKQPIAGGEQFGGKLAGISKNTLEMDPPPELNSTVSYENLLGGRGHIESSGRGKRFLEQIEKQRVMERRYRFAVAVAGSSRQGPNTVQWSGIYRIPPRQRNSYMSPLKILAIPRAF